MADLAMAVREVRRTSLTPEEIESFATSGFLKVGRLLSAQSVEELRLALGEAMSTEREQDREYDLLDPALWPKDDKSSSLEPGKSVGFLFNLWLRDLTFRAVAFDPRLADWASQLIGARQVRLFEDNALYKEPFKGGELKWHQDYSYWPLAQPNAVTAWIALDKVTADNGAVKFAPGSHLLGERLPANFGTGSSYLLDRRASCVREMGEPASEGLSIETMELEPGEVSFHHSMTWHASGPNTTANPRRAFVVRYAGDGTIWLGSRRYEYNYSDDEVGVPIGEPLGGRYFPIVPS